MFITCHPFIARQLLHVELSIIGIEVVNLLSNPADKILTRLALVQVCKGLDNGLVISKDNQVLVGFVCSKL